MPAGGLPVFPLYTSVTWFRLPGDGFCSFIPVGGIYLLDYTIPVLFVYLFAYCLLFL